MCTLNFANLTPRFFDPKLIRWGGDHVEVHRNTKTCKVSEVSGYIRLHPACGFRPATRCGVAAVALRFIRVPVWGTGSEKQKIDHTRWKYLMWSASSTDGFSYGGYGGSVFFLGKVERYVMYYNSAIENIDSIYMAYIEDIDAETNLFMDTV